MIENHWGETRNPPERPKRPGSRFPPRPPFLPPQKTRRVPAAPMTGEVHSAPAPAAPHDVEGAGSTVPAAPMTGETSRRRANRNSAGYAQ